MPNVHNQQLKYTNRVDIQAFMYIGRTEIAKERVITNLLVYPMRSYIKGDDKSDYKTCNYETDTYSNSVSTYSLSFAFVIAPSLLLSGTSCPFLKRIKAGNP